MGYRMLAAIGRFFISIIFIALGITAIFNWDIAKSELSAALGNWELYIGHIEGVAFVFQNLITVVPLLVILGIALQIAGGFLVGLSIRVRMGALLLLLQIIPATTLYHHFWFLEGPAMARSLILFLKNLSIVGGLLIIIAAGQGEATCGASKNKSN